MKFKFLGDPLTPIEGKKGHFKMHCAIVEADSYEAALELAKQQFPQDGKVWGGFSMEPLVVDEDDQ